MTDSGAQPATTASSSAGEIYAALVTMAIHAEDLRWARLNTLLIVDSLLLAAWVGIFAATSDFVGRPLFLAALCVPGVFLGVPFAFLGSRQSEYLDEYHSLGISLEKSFPEPFPRPMSLNEARRATVRTGWRRLTSSKQLVISIPLAFSALFMGLIVASFCFTPPLPANQPLQPTSGAGTSSGYERPAGPGRG